MTTDEMIVLCSSLQAVGRCILLCLVLGFATFSASGKFGYPPTYGLLHTAACRSTANFPWGPLVLCWGVTLHILCFIFAFCTLPCSLCCANHEASFRTNRDHLEAAWFSARYLGKSTDTSVRWCIFSGKGPRAPPSHSRKSTFFSPYLFTLLQMEVLHPPSSDQEPKVLPYLKGKKIDLVINIPSPGDSTSEETQGYLVRRSAVDFGMPFVVQARLHPCRINVRTCGGM